MIVSIGSFCNSKQVFYLIHLSKKTIFHNLLMQCSVSDLTFHQFQWFLVLLKEVKVNWPYVMGIHRSLVDSPHKGHWRGALIFRWSAHEQTAEQIIETLVIWDAAVHSMSQPRFQCNEIPLTKMSLGIIYFRVYPHLQLFKSQEVNYDYFKNDLEIKKSL